MPEDQRPVHPEYRGKKEWKWTEPAQKSAALLLASQIPRGESKDLLSLTLPRRRSAAVAWLSEPMILSENVLTAFAIVIVSILAWYGTYHIMLDAYSSLKKWLRRDRKAAVILKVKPTGTRNVGVQSQCHYTWHDTEQRFKAYENGFNRSGEVSVDF